MGERCELRQANGLSVQQCDEERCIFWRVAEHVGGTDGVEGCAIQHYELLGDSEVARWLISVKERLEADENRDRGSGSANR